MHIRIPFIGLGAAILLAFANAASAAPFIAVQIEGSPAGAGLWTNNLEVVNGGTYDYRVRFTLAPVGTTNTNPAGTANDQILSYQASPANGLGNIKISLFQSTGDLVQVDYAVPTLDGNYDEPPGANAGVLTARGNGNDNVIGVQAVAAAGSFFGVPTTDTPAPTLLFTGQFTVTSGTAGQSGTANVGLQGVVGTFGGMKYNGAATYNPTTTQQNGAQPPVDFQSLGVFIVPEPASLGLLGLAGLGLLRRRR